MLSHGFSQSSYDSCVYIQSISAGSLIYLVLYVDDMLVAYKSMLKVQDLKEQLSKEIDMNDLREAKKILGMEIFRDKNNEFLYLS